MPALVHLFKTCDKASEDIRAVVVAKGPGSFTGLRVGLSVAKGIAHGLGIPIIGVSGLEAMAVQLPFAHLPICAMISSRRGEVFIALFIWNDRDGIKRIMDEKSIRFDDMASVIDAPTLFIGNDMKSQKDPIKKLLKEKALMAPSHLWNLKASAVGTLGLKRFLDNRPDDIRDLVPDYLRSPDIRPNPFQGLSDN